MQKKSEKAVNKAVKWFPLLIFLASFLVYSNTLDHGFVLDDYSVIIEHQHVQAGADGISEILSTNYRHGHQGFNDGLYRPLSLVTFALEKEFFDSSPKIAHWINVLLYCLSVVLLYLGMKRIFKHDENAPLIAALTALLFASHPLHTEVVANIKGRDELLAFFGFGLSLYGFLKSHEKGSFYLLGLLGLTLALFSKENAVLYVFMIPLLVYFQKGVGLRRIQVILLGTLPLGTVFILLRKHIINSMENAVDPGNFGLLNNPLAVADGSLSWGSTFALQLKFLEKIFFPFELIHDYSYNQIPLVELISWQSILGILILFGLIGFGIWGVIKKNKWGMTALLYLMTIVIASQIFTKIGVHFAERLLFMAVLPFSMLLTFIILKYFKKKQFALIFVVVIVNGFYSGRASDRNEDWENNFSLYKADIEKGSGSARVNYNYGSALSDQADVIADANEKQRLYELSALYLKKATEIYPDYLDAWNNLGIVYKKSGQIQKSIEIYQNNIERDPKYAKNYYNIGTAYYQLKDYKRALEYLTEYTNRIPNSPDAYMLMAQTAGNMDKFPLAISYLNAVLQYQPDNAEAYNMLGMAYGTLDQFIKAEKAFLKAINLHDQNIQFYLNLSVNYHNAGMLEKEIRTLKKILQIQSHHPTALQQLIMVLESEGRIEEAQKYRAILGA